MNEMNSQETVVLSDNAVISEDALGYTECECHFFKRYIAALKIYSTFSWGRQFTGFHNGHPNSASCVEASMDLLFTINSHN